MLTKFKLDNGADPTEEEIVTLREQAAEISDQIIGASSPYRGYSSLNLTEGTALMLCGVAY